MLILVRHGETALNAARVVQPFDTPLSARGSEQALRLSRRLAQMGVAQVLCSDLPRARMTAEPLLRASGATVYYTPLLQERDFGDLRGRPYSEITQDIFAAEFVPPAGESVSAFDARVASAWQEVLGHAAQHQGNLVVITHGLVCRSIVRQFLALSYQQTLPAMWSNTSVTVCEAAAPHAISVLNCVAHLDGHGGPARTGAV